MSRVRIATLKPGERPARLVDFIGARVEIEQRTAYQLPYRLTGSVLTVAGLANSTRPTSFLIVEDVRIDAGAPVDGSVAIPTAQIQWIEELS